MKDIGGSAITKEKEIILSDIVKEDADNKEETIIYE